MLKKNPLDGDMFKKNPLAGNVYKKMVLSRLGFELEIALPLLWAMNKLVIQLTLLETTLVKVKKKMLIELALLKAMFRTKLMIKLALLEAINKMKGSCCVILSDLSQEAQDL